MLKIVAIIFLSFIFSSTDLNKFKISDNYKSILLEVELNTSLDVQGYQKITGDSYNHTIEPGFPELPTHTTFYQLNPEKEYEIEHVVHDSYLVEDIVI